MKTTQTSCIKCQGTGKVIYRHIENGKCFECNGSGKYVVRHIGAQKLAPRDPAQERQSFINRFAAAIRNIKAEGKSFLNELADEHASSTETERDNVRAWLNSAKCPADVRARAIAAFAGLGVEI
jgi:RecJ-like exonuclease